jgi:hypothetical protein
VIHVIGLEVGEEQNGEVRFQISSFLKKLRHESQYPLELIWPPAKLNV